MAHDLDNTDRRIVDVPIKKILEMPIRNMKDWIRRTENFVKLGLRRAKQQTSMKTHPITKFFAPRHTTERHQRNQTTITTQNLSRTDT
jgi:hypothetical protein